MADEKPDDLTNPAPDDATGGTPEQGAGNAEADVNREKLLQTLQEKAARVNAAEAEAKALKAQVEALTRVQTPAAHGSDPRADRRQALRDVASSDPLVAEVLDTNEELMNELRMTQRELANALELRDIADKAKRDRVTKYFNENRHRLGDVKAARAEIENEDLAAELERERAEKEKLRKALEATSSRQNPDVVRTHTREVPAAEHKAREMTQAEWDAEQASLPVFERMAAQREMVAGRIRIKT